MPMFAASLKSFVMRHRYSLRDLSVLVAALMVLAYVAFDIEIFERQGQLTSRQKTIALDEALLLGGILAVGLFVFAVRRYIDQKREIARRIEAEHHVRSLAFEDQLTGLPNRRRYDDALNRALGEVPQAGGAHAIFLLDLNGFKRVNDVYGHATGDQILIAVAGRLRGAMRSGDLVARFGGDEFAIPARHLSGAETATTIARRVIESFKAPIVLNGVSHPIGVGIGIALYPENAETAGELLRKADMALYRAKAERRSALRFFDAEMDRQVSERAELERALRAAIADDAIGTVFRPVLDLQDGQVALFEAEPRWISTGGHMVPPGRFLAIAEDLGLIHDIAAHTFRDACKAAKTWPSTVGVSVTLYPAQLQDHGLPLRMMAGLLEASLSPARCEVRLPESSFVADNDAAVEVLGALREAGIKVALDHFGAGYSTLSHLRRFRPDRIKIDRGFVASAAQDGEGRAVLNALIGLGRGLGLQVAADGVNSPDMARSLLSDGCFLGQGAVAGEVLSEAEADQLLRQAA